MHQPSLTIELLQRARRLHMQLRGAVRSENLGGILLRGASGALCVSMMGTGLGFVLQVFLARVLGAAAFGDYIYAFCWMNLLALFGRLGLDTATLRFVAAYHGQEDWGRMRGFLRRSQQTALAASCLTAAVAVATVWLCRSRFRPELVPPLMLALAMLPAWTQMQLRGAALTSLRKIIAAQAPQAVLRPVLLIAGVTGMVFVLGCDAGAALAMAMHLAATLLVVLMMSRLVQRFLPVRAHQSPPAYDTRHWARTLAPLSLLAGLEVLDEQADVLMVGALVSTTEAGIYAAVSRFSLLITFGFMAVNAITAPMISQLYAQRELARLQRLTTLAARGVLLFALPMAVGILLAGPMLLSWFGPEFVAGYRPLAVLTLAQLATAIIGPVGFLLTMTGHQHLAFRVRVTTCVLNIALNAVLIPWLGILGAAISMTLTTCLWKVGMLYYVRRTLGIYPTVLARLEPGVH